MVFKKILPPLNLQDWNIIFPLDPADLLDPPHPLGQILQNPVIHLFDAAAKLRYLLL
jgi:hypothetical protein